MNKQNKLVEEIKIKLLDKVDEFFPKVKPNGVNKGRGEAGVIVGMALAEFSKALEQLTPNTQEDVEEIKKEFEELFGAVDVIEKDSKCIVLKDTDVSAGAVVVTGFCNDRVFNFFLPHLKPVEKIREEAVREFFEVLDKRLLGFFDKGNRTDETLDLKNFMEQYLQTKSKEEE